ncbi:hypothetical protein ACL7TT_01940 [Microbulbifer sp. 2304DJ12-6]|uniref:hypothetical protein n=1 Tax=Microbulbifer sp. 2304DJ12-6 TaxID=3233340 RepID=UPI0039B0241B
MPVASLSGSSASTLPFSAPLHCSRVITFPADADNNTEMIAPIRRPDRFALFTTEQR